MMTHYYNGTKVKLHGIFQFSTVVKPSSLIGGHNGGQISYPIAIIEFPCGTIKQIQDINALEKIDEPDWGDEE